MEKKHVHLVDDDSIFQLLGTKALDREAVDETQIQKALNGQQALDMLKDPGSPRPDVILLDLNMPIMNGFEFLEAFNKLTTLEKNDRRVVVVTSSASPGDIEKAKALGAKEYLTKPLLDEQLTAVLKVA